VANVQNQHTLQAAKNSLCLGRGFMSQPQAQKHVLFSRVLKLCNSKAVPIPPCRRQGEWRHSSCSFLTSALDGVSGQRQALPRFTLGKDSRCALDRRLAGP
jgi:hypothetical protein